MVVAYRLVVPGHRTAPIEKTLARKQPNPKAIKGVIIRNRGRLRGSH